MIKLPLDYRSKIAPQRVFFTWDITYKCNYRCSYCNFNEPGGWLEPEPTVYPGIEKWIEVWQQIYERYGSCEIHCAGGEPFVYPDFMPLIKGLSEIHTLEFSTNLSWEPDDFITRVSPGRARIGTSFHPEFVSFEVFFGKVKKLKAAGFEVWVNYVGYPPIFEGMQKFKQEFEQVGVHMSILPFKGEYESKRYPEGYTEEEKLYLRKCAGSDNWTHKTMDFAFANAKREDKSRLCRMGQMYAKIHSNADAFSCCAKTAKKLGNLLDGTFALLEEPLLCEDNNCPCWKGMVIGKEEAWATHWVVPPDARQAKNDKLSIALVQAPVWGIFEPPVALAQLSSYLKQNNLETNVFDLNIELYRARKQEYNTCWAIEQSSFWSNAGNVKKFFDDNDSIIKEHIDKILQTRPAVVGFSVNACSLLATIELARLIKNKASYIKTVIGGPMFFVTFDLSDILKHDCIDVVVIGEGEETFLELSDGLLKGKNLEDCKGICFRKDGKIVKTQEREEIKNLDKLPFLDLGAFALDKYDPPGHLGKHVSLMASRGCVLNCVYCGPKAYWQGFRFMSGRRIYDEIKHHLQNDPEIEHIEFLDLELNGNIKALSDFCDLMIANPPKDNLKWHANIVIRPEMSRELLFRMKQAGCHHLSIGIETGSQHILDLMKKRYKIEDAERLLQYAYEAGIYVTTNFMFGFPGETAEDFDLTLKFVQRNANTIGIAYPSRSFFTIEPNSYLASHLNEFGVLINSNNNLYWESADGKNNYLERLRRCEEFCKLATKLGVNIGLGLQTSIEADRNYNLGFYYESKKDFKQAKNYFKEYLKFDPKNIEINKKLLELNNGDTGNCPNGRISFNWDITSVCNYRCPYCWFYGKWAELKKRDAGIPAQRLKEFWRLMYEKYGQVKISITGGEPFLYPEFIDLINAIATWHKIEIVTNLSWAVNNLLSSIENANIKIHPSFHPLFADFTQFLNKIILLKEEGFTTNCSYLAWPAQITFIQYYAREFKENGIEMFVQPFFGEYKGISYPDGYTDKQKEALMPYLGQRGGRPFETKVPCTKGKLCNAGNLYGVIHPDGSVLRCGGLDSKDAKIGNILDENFKLLDDAYPCSSEVCPCNEWAFLLKES